jgi:L-asparaginase
VHAVSLLEDDELFNCGRGAVFTSVGTVEMESSIMVTSVRDDGEVPEGAIKRGVGVIGIRNVRHPVQLAREALLRAGIDSDGNPVDDGGNMHSQLSGPYLERLARDWGLEFKSDSWFWTKRRWDEHLRGLKGIKEDITMSQGTVGCVCLDQWGNLATATSTGGLTNKRPGRVGDTPTLGAGFWAESWIEQLRAGRIGMVYTPQIAGIDTDEVRVNWDALSPWSLLQDLCLGDCVGERPTSRSVPTDHPSEKQPLLQSSSSAKRVRRAVALSGTGNGDSFLRVNAARTATAMLRFSSSEKSIDLSKTVTAVAGPDGELQQSAGQRWNKTGEGQGGLIGIEAEVEIDRDQEYTAGTKLNRGKVVFDFNCEGMFRAWMEEDAHGENRERVMVFRDEYQE